MFVFFGVVTAIALVFVYGAGRYLHETRQYVTYFAESVQGLEVNAPVKFRGLQIGRVEDIKLAPDGRLIEVLMRVDSGKFKARRDANRDIKDSCVPHCVHLLLAPPERPAVTCE